MAVASGSRSLEPPRARVFGIETVIGALLLGGVALLGAFLAYHQGENRIDAWFYARIPHRKHAWLPDVLVDLGSVPALVLGSVVAVVVTIRRDPWRSLTCGLSPVLATLISDQIVKPLVDRYIAPGELTFPSGTVTVAAALATVAVLVTPPGWKPASVAGSIAALVGVCLSVLVLRWHFATDVIGACGLGIGVVLCVDGLVGLARRTGRDGAVAGPMVMPMGPVTSSGAGACRSPRSSPAAP